MKYKYSQKIKDAFFAVTVWTFTVSAQRCPCFFAYLQDNLSYNVLLVTMWIAYNVTRWWNRFLVTDVTRRQYGKIIAKGSSQEGRRLCQVR